MTKIDLNSGIQDIQSSKNTNDVDTISIEYPKDAEKVNGRWAMLGLVALIGAYASTGQIIPGIF